MSLVAYASSGDEDSDSDHLDTVIEAAECIPNLTDISLQDNNETSLFTLLPPPKKPDLPITVEEDDIPSLTGEVKKRATVKIIIPSLNDFQDDDVIKTKKIKLAPKGSGLLGILPKPQNFSLKESQRKLTPNVLTKAKSSTKELDKPKSSAKPITTIRPMIMPVKTTSIIPRTIITKKLTQVKKNDSDDDEEVTDFFSLDQKDELPPYPILPEIPRLEIPNLDSQAPSSETTEPAPKANYVNRPIDVSDKWLEQYEETESEIATIPEGPELFADEGFKRLTGKNKKVKEEINFIEINAADQLPNKDEWLKSISVEKATTSHKKTGMPSAQSRRKHQITYLAYQAKERELELKNQWAMNRMTRQQTQAKYGF